MLEHRLGSLTRKIRDKTLRDKVVELLENPAFVVDGKANLGLPLDTSPAGLSHHHSYEGGYVEHVVSTANIALALCDSVEKVYHGRVNRDLVVAGVLLHDAFKPATYSIDETGEYRSTCVGEYLDHLSIATAELTRRSFPLELIHIVSAHHGEYGPIRPRTVEALICHFADLVDSRFNGAVLEAASYLSRRATGQQLHRLNSKEAFEIVRSKSLEGWEGVAKTFEKLKRRRKSHKA